MNFVFLIYFIDLWIVFLVNDGWYFCWDVNDKVMILKVIWRDNMIEVFYEYIYIFYKLIFKSLMRWDCNVNENKINGK